MCNDLIIASHSVYGRQILQCLLQGNNKIMVKVLPRSEPFNRGGKANTRVVKMSLQISAVDITQSSILFTWNIRVSTMTVNDTFEPRPDLLPAKTMYLILLPAYGHVSAAHGMENTYKISCLQNGQVETFLTTIRIWQNAFTVLFGNFAWFTVKF